MSADLTFTFDQMLFAILTLTCAVIPTKRRLPVRRDFFSSEFQRQSLQGFTDNCLRFRFRKFYARNFRRGGRLRRSKDAQMQYVRSARAAEKPVPPKTLNAQLAKTDVRPAEHGRIGVQEISASEKENQQKSSQNVLGSIPEFFFR